MIDTTGIKVPTSLVPRAYVDYDMEAQQILGLPFELPDGACIPPLTPAALIALELVSSPFFKDPHGCDALDAAASIRIMTVAVHQPDQLGALTRDPDTRNTAAAEWLLQHGDALAKVYELVVQWILDVPFYGFAMRPGQGKRREKYFWFDGEFAGALLAPASKILATPVQDILWHTPLCLIGHAVAQHDAAMGTKGVERPPDLAALDRMMAEAAEREDRGELHPWQYIDPDNYGLTDRQVRANPDLIGTFAQILDDVHAGRHPQPPPADPNPEPQPATPSASEAEPTITVKAPPYAQ